LTNILASGPLNEVHKIVKKKDLLLLEGILPDLETRASQEHPRRVSTRELPTHGICKISMPGPFREDLTRIAKKFF